MDLYHTNFTQLDWVIVVVYLATSIVIGLWANRYVGNLSDYLVAGRTLRIRLALASMTGTEFGLVTFMYMSEMGFTHQYAALYLAVIEGIGILIIGLTGFFVTRMRQSAVLTLPEFYQRRYGSGVRVVGGTMMVVSGVLNMGLFLKVGSQFLTAVAGLEDGIYLKWIMTGLLLLVLFYTVLGGMVSVVITDLIQFFVLGIGMVVITGMVVTNIGPGAFWDVVTQFNAYFDPTDPVNRSNPAGDGIGLLKIVEMTAVISSASLLWPPMASRTLSVRTPETARKLYLFSTIPMMARNAIPVIWGIAAYWFFKSNTAMSEALYPAIENGEISTLSAMPLYLAKIVPTGLLGLVTAGMVAAFMSTHDSYLLCWSGVVTQDIVAPIFGPLSQRTRITLTRVCIVTIGLFLLTWGLWYEISTNLWDYMAITGTVYFAGALPAIVCGLYWKRASSVGAYGALLGGLCGLLAMGPSLNMLNESLFADSEFTLRGAHITILTFVVSFSVFVVGSLLFPDRPRTETSSPDVEGKST